MADDILDVGDNLADVPAFYTGTGASNLVPSVFPVAINGRPYMIDRAANSFVSGFEGRVRDAVDQGAEPGEGTLNTQGLWRRGQSSWHFGAGQEWADDAAAEPYRFYKSKGVNPWTKGKLSLLNATLLSKDSAATAQHMVVQDGRVYVALGGDLFYSSNPFSTSATWTTCTGEPGGGAVCTALATDGYKIFVAFTNDGIRQIDPDSSVSAIGGPTSNHLVNSSENYYMIGFAKGYLFATHDYKLYKISDTGTKTEAIVPFDTAFKWVGVATGQNAMYAAGYSGTKSIVYKLTVKADGTLDTAISALELPTGEVVTAISGYLGFILLGTNKGVRFCSTDSNSNLVAGPVISTPNQVNKFASNDRFTYFTYTNYDGISGGLGRLDLSVFTAANTPAYATDLMYDSTAAVNSVVVFTDPVTNVAKPVFLVSGVGVIAEDSANLVSSGYIETGKFKWSIQDRKFVAFADLRTEPLDGSVAIYSSLDNGDYVLHGTFNTTDGVEYSAAASEDKTIHAQLKAVLTRASALLGPVVTRIAARAYATPARSRYFKVPVVLHHKIRLWDHDYFFDVDRERQNLEDLVMNPRVIVYQEGNRIFSVIAEELEWQSIDTTDRDWTWEGTATITLRSIQE